MTQTLAIFYQAYLNLNSKKLFWIVLAISGLVVVAFACVENNERGVKFLFWQMNSDMFNSNAMSRGAFYKWIFTTFGIPYWLAWPATLLALISTAGIFPDLITSGSIDLYVSKPISRLRLFLTEYGAGLLFVTLQVTIFSLMSFLVIGIRGGAWQPGLFLAIPLTVCIFSYLFAVCVLLGVVTRSTVAALLLTLLFWFGVGMIGTSEETLFALKTLEKHGVDVTNPNAPAQHGTIDERASDSNLDNAPGARSNKETDESGFAAAHNVFYKIKTVLPKPGETSAMLARSLVNLADLPKTDENRLDSRSRQERAVQEDMMEAMRNRSWGWVVGTSLVFEGLVLAAAAFVFCRRDY